MKRKSIVLILVTVALFLASCGAQNTSYNKNTGFKKSRTGASVGNAKCR